MIEARSGYYSEDAIHGDLNDTVDTIMTSLRDSGYEPVIDPDAIEIADSSTAAANRG